MGVTDTIWKKDRHEKKTREVNRIIKELPEAKPRESSSIDESRNRNRAKIKAKKGEKDGHLAPMHAKK